MKILFIHPATLDLISNDGDLQNSVLSVVSLCQAFSDLGMNTTLALPVISDTEAAIYRWLQDNLSHHPKFQIKPLNKSDYQRNRKNKFYKYFVSSEIVQTINATVPDLVITRNAQWGIYFAKLGFKTIIDIHSPILAQYSIIDRITKYLIKKYIKCKNLKLIVISKNLSEYYGKLGITPQNIIVAHNGFDPDMYNFNPSKEMFKKKYDIPGNHGIAMYAGSFWPGRGTDLLLDVAGLLPDITFIMIGGPERFKANLVDEMKRKELQNVIIISSVKRNLLPEHLFSADVLVGIFSSKLPTAEYFSSLKLIEYMATGKPIVTQDYLSVQELIVDGETGYIARRDCAHSLAKKISKAFTDPLAAQIGNKAREVAFSQLTWAHRAKKFLGCYDTTASN